MSVNVRVARIDDIPTIQYIAKSSWERTYENLIPVLVQGSYLNEHYSTQQLYHKIKNQFFFVVESENELVGFANLFITERE